jgi:hypothetical protein
VTLFAVARRARVTLFAVARGRNQVCPVGVRPDRPGCVGR